MRIEPDILMGVAVPVFAVSSGEVQYVLAWNAGMVTLTGIPTERAVGRTVETVFGAGAAALGNVERSGPIHIEGLGTVLVNLHAGLIVGTLSDQERDAFIGLAAQDLRAPLRIIHQLADDAAKEGVPAHPAFARIKRIARQGMSMTRDVVSCAEAGSVAASGFRKVAVAPLCRALLDSVSTETVGLVLTSPTTVIVEKPLMQAALRRLFEHLLHGSSTRQPVIELDVYEAPAGFCISVGCVGADPKASVRRLLEGGAFRGDEGYGLLGLRRLVRSRGGHITVADGSVSGPVRIELTLPGCVIETGLGRAFREAEA